MVFLAVFIALAVSFACIVSDGAFYRPSADPGEFARIRIFFMSTKRLEERRCLFVVKAQDDSSYGDAAKAMLAEIDETLMAREKKKAVRKIGSYL